MAAARVDLHEAHAALDQPAGHEAAAAKLLGDQVVEAVQPLGRLGLMREIDGLRCVRLHAKRQLVTGDAGRELRVLRVGGAVVIVEGGEQVELVALLLHRNLLGRPQVEDRIAGRAELRPLVGRGHEAGTPVGRSGDGPAAMIEEHDEGRQVLIDRPQAVGHPGTEAGVALANEAGVHLQQARAVGEAVGVATADDRHVVGALAKRGEEVGDFDAGLAALQKLAR